MTDEHEDYYDSMATDLEIFARTVGLGARISSAPDGQYAVDAVILLDIATLVTRMGQVYFTEEELHRAAENIAAARLRREAETAKERGAIH